MSGGWFALSGTALQRRAGIEDSDAVFLADMIRDRRWLRRRGAACGLSLLGRRTAIAAIDHAGAWTAELKVSAGMTIPRAHLIRIRRSARAARARGRRRGCRDLHRQAGRRSRLGRHPGEGHPRPEETCSRRAGVVLATGGFSRSRELLDLFVPDQAAAMPYGGVGNTGDGLRMGWMLGAGLADIGHVSGTYGQHAETSDDEHELLTANYLGAILVNSLGERFTDESESYKVLGSAVLNQPGRMAFQIFDARVRALSKPGVPLSDMGRSRSSATW